MTFHADSPEPHRVVILGAGFGGLWAVKHLKGAPVDITLIDQRNHHLFQPLLYQVATASLAPSEIAWPIRSMLSDRKDVTTILATVTGVDASSHAVHLADGPTVRYQTLILATGARDSYFGHDEWEALAPGLKTIEDATAIRGRILKAFEEAERETNPRRQEALLTFAVVGAGPTGVELAGTIADLAHDTLPSDFRAIDTRKTRVLLIEAGSTVLSSYPDELSQYAKSALEKLGVEVSLGVPVSRIEPNAITFGERRIDAHTIIWAAGVHASPAAEWLGAPADRSGRIIVEPDLSVPGHRDIFAVGDTAAVKAPDGSPVPGIAPAAKQEGAFVAETIRRRISGDSGQRSFHYHHEGSLAQIGKRRAVIDFGRIKLRGALAWRLWGIAHIYFLVGVRSRLSVALNWLWIYMRNQRSARLITRAEGEPAIE